MGSSHTKHYVRGEQETYNVYFRNIDGTLGVIKVGNITGQDCQNDEVKEAVLQVKELLVQGGDCLTNKAVLAIIEGGNNGR